MYVSFVNLQSHPSMVHSYSVDMQIEDGDWIKLKRIPVYEGSSFEPVFLDTSGAYKVDVDNFEETISGNNILPHEPKFGWMFFDVPTDYHVPKAKKVVFRFVIREVTGVASEILVDLPTQGEGSQLKSTMAKFHVKEKISIENYEKGYFSKLYPNCL